MTDRALADRLLACLDLTSLGDDDPPGRIAALCDAATTPRGPVAAVCVYPEHVQACRARLGAGPVRVATVVNFPDGSADSGRARREVRRALAVGAQAVAQAQQTADVRFFVGSGPFSLDPGASATIAVAQYAAATVETNTIARGVPATPAKACARSATIRPTRSRGGNGRSEGTTTSSLPPPFIYDAAVSLGRFALAFRLGCDT